MQIKKLLEAITILEIYKGSKKYFNKIIINSQTIKKDDLFIAIKGKEKDGHDYVDDALKKGCHTVIVSKLNKKWIAKNNTIIVVEDTNKTLLQLGKYYRDMYSIPLIAVTGSVGKTTTKELISNILSNKYNVLKSPSNYNNKIGIPLTLFNLNKEHQLIVMELGMNHLKEIHELSMICKPDISIITNIGTAHIGNLKGKKNIKKAKMEIIDGMVEGYLILNPFDKNLRKIKKNNLEIIYPLDNLLFYITNLKLYEDSTYLLVHYNNATYPLYIPIPGIKSFENIVLAIQIGIMFNIDMKTIIMSISNFTTSNGRLNKFKLQDNVTLIDDSYNASLESLENDISILKIIRGRKILIFGDFLELGKYSKKIHKKAAKLIKSVKDLEVYLVGNMAFKMMIKNSKKFKDVDEILTQIQDYKLDNCTILIKGSRKMGLEKIVKYIKKDYF